LIIAILFRLTLTFSCFISLTYEIIWHLIHMSTKNTCKIWTLII